MSHKNFTNVAFMCLIFFVLMAVFIYGVFSPDFPLYMDLP